MTYVTGEGRRRRRRRRYNGPTVSVWVAIVADDVAALVSLELAVELRDDGQRPLPIVEGRIELVMFEVQPFNLHFEVSVCDK